MPPEGATDCVCALPKGSRARARTSLTRRKLQWWWCSSPLYKKRVRCFTKILKRCTNCTLLPRSTKVGFAEPSRSVSKQSKLRRCALACFVCSLRAAPVQHPCSNCATLCQCEAVRHARWVQPWRASVGVSARGESSRHAHVAEGFARHAAWRARNVRGSLGTSTAFFSTGSTVDA